LRNQAPRYAKLLPELPYLFYDFLRRRPGRESREIAELLREQRRTNRLLQGIIYTVIGFALGMLAMQVLIRVQWL